ncbi:hypothetical protein COR50_02385 [Chitinophaga caeni]|uniref:DUF4293 domain-containing protein n=1 Tax=Chitinophaga caeni TaxID=2029983 RepID=A0A291QQB2_9BACT|nr:DUF4293 domain-containing protein [Chitinophaga caeni]ATL46105.1 hypothetical protein COR50_02385 [Chitinophaga caeni]
MIQRIQSLYLLMAAACGVATWFFDIWKGTFGTAPNADTTRVNAQSNFALFVLYMLIVALAAVCIFLYKNRKLQFKLTVINILLSIGALVLQYFVVQNYENSMQEKGMILQKSTYLPAAFLPIMLIILLILAARGIYKDEKLIKSLDRLR